MRFGGMKRATQRALTVHPPYEITKSCSGRTRPLSIKVERLSLNPGIVLGGCRGCSSAPCRNRIRQPENVGAIMEVLSCPRRR